MGIGADAVLPVFDPEQPLATSICTYLADSAVGGLGVIIDGDFIPLVPPAGSELFGDLQNIEIAPNYPSTPSGILFDALSATVKSTSSAIPLPTGTAIVVELVENAGSGDEEVCMAVSFPAGPPGPPGLLVPIIVPLRDSVEDLCLIEPGNTYDVRVCLRNTTDEQIGLALSGDAFIQVAVTARSRSA